MRMTCTSDSRLAQGSEAACAGSAKADGSHSVRRILYKKIKFSAASLCIFVRVRAESSGKSDWAPRPGRCGRCMQPGRHSKIKVYAVEDESVLITLLTSSRASAFGRREWE